MLDFFAMVVLIVPRVVTCVVVTSACMSLTFGTMGLASLFADALNHRRVSLIPSASHRLAFLKRDPHANTSVPPVSPPPPLPPAPCEDDPSWSVDSRGVYTCRWLSEQDPGCELNACGGNDDYGQCSACPHTCHSCNGQRVSSGLIPAQTRVLSISTGEDGTQRLTLDGFDDLSAEQADSALRTEQADDTPVVLAVAPLLLLAGIGGLAAAYHDYRGLPESLPLVARLIVLTALLYVMVLLALVLTYVPRHPDMCTVYWRRVVPLTPQTAQLGEVVSFFPRGIKGNHLYAVLIKARLVDILADTCLLVSLGLPVLSLTLLTHVAYWQRIAHRVRSLTRVHRVVERIISTMHIASYGELKRMPPMAATTRLAGSEASPSIADGSVEGGGEGGTGGGTGDGSRQNTEAGNSERERDPTDGDGGGGPASCDCDYEHGSQAHASTDGATASSFIGTDCPICMEEYEVDDEVLLLPCRHVLHKECLLSWARACAKPQGAGGMPTATCPLCKTNLVPEGAQLDDDGCAAVCFELPIHSRRTRVEMV